MATNRPMIPKRKYPTAQVPGTLGKSAPIDTSGVDREMQRTLGISGEPENPVTVKPKKSGIDWWKLLGIKH